MAQASGNSWQATDGILAPMKHRERTATVIGRNIAMLAEGTGVDLQQVALRAGVGIRTLHHILAGKNTTIDTAEAVARVFGLTCWHLLNPNLRADLANEEWLARLRVIFGTAPAEGVDLVKRAVVAAETITELNKAKTG